VRKMKVPVVGEGALFVRRNFASASLNHRVKLVLVVVTGVGDIGDGAPSATGRDAIRLSEGLVFGCVCCCGLQIK
jgi:hypothetical protein